MGWFNRIKVGERVRSKEDPAWSGSVIEVNADRTVNVKWMDDKVERNVRPDRLWKIR